MVVIENPNEYRFVKFEKSKTKNKKYDAILQNKNTGRLRKVSFGDKRYKQYKDQTGLGLYSNLNHLDKSRRERYRTRHQGEEQNKYSSGWFSFYYLW